MSIASEIQRINTNIENAYSKVSEKGGTLPVTQNSANLASAINSIQTGGSSNVLVVPNGMKFAYSSTLGDFQLDTSSVTSMSNMFYYCSQLTAIPLLDTSSVTDMSSMFYYCSRLTTIPLLDTSSVLITSSMFNTCSRLTAIPLLDTSSVLIMNNMFNSCSQLTTIPLLDTSSVTSMDNTFKSCSRLSNESLNNILQMCINATSYTGTKTLKQIGLSSSQATTCQSLSNWDNFVAAGWSTGY